MKLQLTIKSLLTLTAFFCFFQANAQNHVELINSQKILKEGVDLYDDEKYEKAMALFQKVPQGDTNYFACMYELSMCLYKLDKLEETVELSRRMIAEGSPQLGQYNMLGSALDDLKRRDEAIAVYDEALKKYPYSTNLWLNKGIVYESAENYQKAYECYQKVLEISPLYASGHLRMAYLAEGEGKLTLATMAFATFFLIEPDSRRSLDAIEEFNKMCNNSSNRVNTNKTKVLPNEYEDLDFLIQNQVALNNKYKVPGKMKYPVNKQLHLVMEKLAGVKSNESSSYYTKFYIDFFNDYLKTGNYADFSLLMLASSDNEKIAKEVKKKTESLKKTRNQGVEKLMKMHEGREFTYDGKKYNLDFFYYKNFNVEGLGKQNAANKNVGFWVFFDNSGYIEVTGFYDETGNKIGEWYFYNAKGDTTKKLTYKNNLADGEYIIYKNGRRKEIGTYVNDKLEGWVTEFYPDGTVSTKDQFKNDEREGDGKSYYANGQVHFEYSFTEGKPNGNITEYYNHGVLKETSTYKLGKNEGNMKQYHENKQLSKDCNFVNDLLEGPYKTYFMNGKVEKEGVAVKGQMSGKWINYYSDGSIEDISYLDENGKVNGEEESFDHKGIKYRLDTYQKGDWKNVIYYTKDGKVFYETKIAKSGTRVTNYNFQLDKVSEGLMKDNERDGVWNFYLPNGFLSSIENYRKGKLEGESKAFHTNGNVSGVYLYKNGERNGLELKYHENGNLLSEVNYIDGNRWGQAREYENDGRMSTEEFYHDDQRRGWSVDFYSNGKPWKKTYYELGVLTQVKLCDTTGNVVDTFYLPNGTGNFQLKWANGMIYQQGRYITGKLHGDLTYFYPDGKVSLKGGYFMGYRHGDWTYYHPNGKVSAKFHYMNGDKTGNWEYFDYEGKMTKMFPYQYTKNTGNNIWYYENGKVESEIGFYEDERHGESRYYAPTGELREVRYYEFGKLIGYSYMGKNGKLVDTIFTKNGDIELKAFYANGNPSTVLEIKNGVYNNSYKIFYPNGKLQEERTYIFGDENGATKRYFADGKLQSVENNLSGESHGETLIYNANGTLRLRENYLNNNLDGLCEYFDGNGKRLHAFYYKNHEMIAIIQ